MISLTENTDYSNFFYSSKLAMSLSFLFMEKLSYENPNLEIILLTNLREMPAGADSLTTSDLWENYHEIFKLISHYEMDRM
jgi:hypothetical protein